MKIVKPIRDIYGSAASRYQRLEGEVKELLKPRVEQHDWFFSGRVKQLESFALKLETGRVSDPLNLEDFYACTIVVPTMGKIEVAENLVRELFDLSHRRPQDDGITHKPASSFVFDDLRLYVARRPPASGSHPDLDGVVFEVQVKTILQHAWSVATHDLIYKSNSVSWPRERIAFQVKAMLEHAEVAIAEANRLADAPAVARRDNQTIAVLRLIEHLKRVWPEERLPRDVKRLAETILALLQAGDCDVARFPSIVEDEKRRLGVLPADLSPYSFVVQALAHTSQLDFQKKFNRRHIGTNLCIHSGMELPDWMKQPSPRIINIG
jgi:ppGpp synthetase/RelA/SpoT-type nucleotidyltranferase